MVSGRAGLCSCDYYGQECAGEAGPSGKCAYCEANHVEETADA